MKKIEILALVLLILGGLNWGIFSVFEFNVIDYVFGKVWIDRVLYFFMGVSAIYSMFTWKMLVPKKTGRR
jgi:uncharacterized protein